MNINKQFMRVILLVAGMLLIMAILEACQQTAPENPALNAKLEAGELLRIMPLGGSVVEGICDKTSQCKVDKEAENPMDGGVGACSFTRSDENPNAAGFRGFLRDMLAAEGVKMTYVGSVEVVPGLSHEGHAHFRIEDIDYCIQNAGWLENAKPDVILLLIGGGDANSSEKPESMIAGLKKLLDNIFTKVPETTEVIVAQHPPFRQGLYPFAVPEGTPVDTPVNDILTEYNAGIPVIVEELKSEGKHVSTVNMWDTVQSDDELSEGGSVPRSVVGERMAQAWLEKIMEILGRPVLVSASPKLQPAQTQAPPPPPKFYVDAPLRIMPMGDAIIEGWCDRSTNCTWLDVWRAPVEEDDVEACRAAWNTVNPEQKGFREFLRNKLVAAGVNLNYVGTVQVAKGLAHEGHLGFTIPDLDYCVQHAKWLEEAKPDMILLGAGATDVFYNVTPEETIERLKVLMKRIYQILPETTEVVVTQLPGVREDIHTTLDPSLPLLNDMITEYNAGLPGVVEEFRADGKPVSLVDLRDTIQSADEFDELGLYPNAVASERIAQVWFEKIMEILEKED